MGVYSDYDIVDKYLHCADCNEDMTDDMFPECFGCDDKIKPRGLRQYTTSDVLCHKHMDKNTFTRKGKNIILCHHCIRPFHMEDRQILRYIDFNLSLESKIKKI